MNQPCLNSIFDPLDCISATAIVVARLDLHQKPLASDTWPSRQRRLCAVTTTTAPTFLFSLSLSLALSLSWCQRGQPAPHLPVHRRHPRPAARRSSATSFSLPLSPRVCVTGLGFENPSPCCANLRNARGFGPLYLFLLFFWFLLVNSSID